MSSDIEHWQINAKVFKDRVEEVHIISDPSRNVRREPQTKIWQIERFLGRGGFGEVRLERNKHDGKTRAVKRIPTTSSSLKDSDCVKELKALLEFSKPKSREAAVFVDFFGWFRDGSDVFLAMEYVQLGDLEKNVSGTPGRIPAVEARDIAEQILSGLAIMHGESFAHRDLKPQNVLVVNGPPRWWIKLADFGLSKRLTDTTAFYTRGGTQSYMAPETLNYLAPAESEITNAVDIWAAGCIIYRLIAGAVPFPPGMTLMKYCEDRSKFPQHALFESEAKIEGSTFIRGLLAANPGERPTARDALRHEWLLSAHGANTHSHDREGPSQSTHRLTQSLEISQRTMSDITYNTVSHEGLRSYNTFLQPNHSIIRHSSMSNSTSASSNSMPRSATIKRKSLTSLNVPKSSYTSSINEASSSHTFNFTDLAPVPQVTSQEANPFVSPDPGNLISTATSDLIPDKTSWGSLLARELTIKTPSDTTTKHLGSITPVENKATSQEYSESQGIGSNLSSNLQPPSPSSETTATMAAELSMTPSVAPTPQIITHAKAIRDFRGTGAPDELPFRAGTIIEIIDSGRRTWGTDDWWQGRIGDRVGGFPMSYVTLALSAVKGQPQDPISRVKAMYDFEPTEDGELAFRKGDVILIVEKAYEDWWMGVLGSRRGVLPANYVEVFPIPTSAELVLESVSHVKTLFNFSPTEPGQLAFRKGDLIRLISTRFEGWWLGELRGKEGTFPLSHVERMPNLPGDPIKDNHAPTAGLPDPYAEAEAVGRKGIIGGRKAGRSANALHKVRFDDETLSRNSLKNSNISKSTRIVKTKLEVTIHGAVGLGVLGNWEDNFLSCQILLDGRIVHKTKSLKSPLNNPFWNERFVVKLDSSVRNTKLVCVIICDCFRHGYLGETLGEAWLSFDSIDSYSPENILVPLKFTDQRSRPAKGNMTGTLRFLPPGEDETDTATQGDQAPFPQYTGPNSAGESSRTISDNTSSSTYNVMLQMPKGLVDDEDIYRDSSRYGASLNTMDSPLVKEDKRPLVSDDDLRYIDELTARYNPIPKVSPFPLDTPNPHANPSLDRQRSLNVRGGKSKTDNKKPDLFTRILDNFGNLTS